MGLVGFSWDIEGSKSRTCLIPRILVSQMITFSFMKFETETMPTKCHWLQNGGSFDKQWILSSFADTI